MTREEFKNMLYNRRYIAGGDYNNENPFVGMWLDDFVEITHEINNELIERACRWLKEQSCCGFIEDVDVNIFISNFKKAMEK